MAGGNAAAWTFMSCVRAYQAAWQERAPVPAFEPAPFPIRIQSAADLAAGVPWRIRAWENPFVKKGPAAPFWDASMLAGEGSATAPPLLPFLAAAGARIDGLRLRSRALIVKIEHGGRAVQIRVANDAPLLAGGGIRLWQEIGHELPAAFARATDLLDVLGCPPPWMGRGRWAKKGNF